MLKGRGGERKRDLAVV